MVEEVPQKRLEQLAFRSSQGGCVIDAPIHVHGAPWVVVVEPVYVAGTCPAVAGQPDGTRWFPAAACPKKSSDENKNPSASVKCLKYYRIILVSSFAVNVAERQDSMQVMQSGAAIVMTVKTGEALRLLLLHPQVLRHMSNHVLEFGIRNTLEWREATILGTPSRDAIAKLHEDRRAAELLDRLHTCYLHVIALTSSIPASLVSTSGGGTTNPSNVRELCATRVPALTAKTLTAVGQADEALSGSLRLDCLYSDMLRFHQFSSTAIAAPPVASPVVPPGGAAATGSRLFHNALQQLQQYDASFLSSVVSAVLSVSKRFTDSDGSGARSSWATKARRAGSGGAYHEFWLHEQALHNKETRHRRKVRATGSHDDAEEGNLGQSQPTSMQGDDDDDVDSSSGGAVGSLGAGGTTSPPSNVSHQLETTAPPAPARGGHAASSIYHHPPYAISYQRTNTRLYGGGGAAHDEDVVLGPNACGSAAPGSAVKPAPHQHAHSLPVHGTMGRTSKLVAATLVANSEMFLDTLLDSQGGTATTTNVPENHVDPSVGSSVTSIFSRNSPEARIFVFTKDPVMARNLLIVCSFFYRHQHPPYADADDVVLRHHCPSVSTTTTTGRHHATNIIGHAAFPLGGGTGAGSCVDNLALFPSLPLVWVPEEWNPKRFPIEQLTNRLSPDTHVVVIAPRLQIVERLQFRKHLSTRDISLERRQNGSIVKQLPFGLSNGCFFSEVVEQVPVTKNGFVVSTINRALHVESKSKGVLNAALYLEEWMHILLQQVIVFATEGATSARCTAAVAQAVQTALQASQNNRCATQQLPTSPRAAASSKLNRNSVNTLQVNSAGTVSGTLITSTNSTATQSAEVAGFPVTATDALTLFNRDLQGLLMCTEVDITHVQLLDFLAEL